MNTGLGAASIHRAARAGRWSAALATTLCLFAPGRALAAPLAPAPTLIKPAPIVTVPKPDLIIQSATISLGGACRTGTAVLNVSVTVKNAGTGPSPARTDVGMVAAADTHGNGWANGVGLPALDAGASATVTIPIYYFGANPSHMPGAHGFQITVNKGNWIAEANSANNNYGPVSVSIPPSLCPVSVAPPTLPPGLPVLTRSGLPERVVPSLPGATPVEPGAADGSLTGTETGSYDYYSGTPPPATPASQSFGTLLTGQLPPPPQNLPPPPPKEDKSIEAGELVVVSGNMAEAQTLANQLKSLGLGVKRRSVMSGLGFVVTVVRVPAAVGTGSALTTLRQTQPNLWADVNHRLELQADDSVHYGRRLIGLTRPEPFCGGGVRIGLVDTAVDANHPALRGRQIESRSFLSAGVPPADPDHGTATAALLVGNSLPSGFSGLAPAARLYSANVFRKRGNQADTTVEAVVQAFDWLAGQNVHIVNLSLGGPRNLLLEAAVERLLARGIAVVAAAGNRGPSAPPMYPAAQPGVIAVTAVDAELKPYKLANRGDYISFAAPGVDVWTALPGKDGAYVSGTSYATPFVTAALVAAYALDPKGGWAGIQKKMQAQARDLGDQGKDPVYGFGLIQIGGCGRTSMGGR